MDTDAAVPRPCRPAPAKPGSAAAPVARDKAGQGRCCRRSSRREIAPADVGDDCRAGQDRDQARTGAQDAAAEQAAPRPQTPAANAAVEKAAPATEKAAPAAEKTAARARDASPPADAAKTALPAGTGPGCRGAKRRRLLRRPGKRRRPRSRAEDDASCLRAATGKPRQRQGRHRRGAARQRRPARDVLVCRADAGGAVPPRRYGVAGVRFQPSRSISNRSAPRAAPIIGDVSRLPLEKGQAIRIRLNRPQMPSLESDGRASGIELDA